MAQPNININLSRDGLDIQRGETSMLGVLGVNGFGTNVDLDIGTEDVIDAGSTLVETLVGTPALVALYSGNANDVLAAGTLTFGDNASDGEVIVIGAKTYTLEDVLTNVDGHVLREAAATDTIDNLIAAINLGAGSGTKYAAATTANAAPTSAVAGAADTMTLYAETAIVTTTDIAGGWGAATAVLGTGARTITIFGLDSSGNLQSVTKNMRGITLTDTDETWSFIYLMEVTTAGSGGTNAGLIKCVDNPETEIYAEIIATNGQSMMAVYKVPTGYTGYLIDYYFSLGITPPAAANVTCFLFVKPSGGAYTKKHSGGIVTEGKTGFRIPFPLPLVVAEGSIVKCRATTDTDDVVLDAAFTLTLIPNDL